MTGTRWLSTDEQQTWRAYLTATKLLAAAMERELLQSSGVSFAYYEILVRLSEAPGRRLRMSDLADVSDSSRSRLSHAVARLEDLGWVVRETCFEDRRGSFAHLTDAGFEALVQAAPAHVESVRRHLFDVLDDDDLDHMRVICQKVADGLRGPCANAEGSAA
jgi:DNA-binding MarR family transcriptional regulator